MNNGHWGRWPALLVSGAALVLVFSLAQGQEEEYEPITSDDCIVCHETDEEGAVIATDLSHSSHDGFECLDCHITKDTMPHKPLPEEYVTGCQG